MNGRPSYELYMMRGPAPDTIYPLSGKNLTIGRDPLSDIPINDPEVSRQHALLISTAAGDFRIQDLGSTNGTFIDGKRVGSKAETLRPSNAITMGGAVTFILRERSTIEEAVPEEESDRSEMIDDAPPAAAKHEKESPASGKQEVERRRPELPLGKPITEVEQVRPKNAQPQPTSQEMAAAVREPEQIESDKPEELSPNLILGLVLLLLCSCATVLAFLIYLRGDWFLRQSGLVP